MNVPFSPHLDCSSSRFYREDDSLLQVDGSRDCSRMIFGLREYLPVYSPMIFELVTKTSKIFVSWSDLPLIAEPGDLILTDEQGHRHPIKQDLFDKTYIYLDDHRATKVAMVNARRIGELGFFHTLEGSVFGQAEDWLAQGIDGECWPIPDRSFRRRYQIDGAAR